MSQHNTSFDTTHFVSLVLNSKKALQHGEQLCSKAHELVSETSNVAAELMASDAKARWVIQGILEQLKLANGVANNLSAQRDVLQEQAKQWDGARSLHAGNLDTILDALGTQSVPPGFYDSPTSSSVFGSQHPDLLDEAETQAEDIKKDRTQWKTLRDFVDERAIEDAAEIVDNDRTSLDDILAVTEDFPQILMEKIASLTEGLPSLSSLPPISRIFDEQERLSTSMARHLENLSSHYDQMTIALQDKESGVEFNEEDLLDMNRDMDELPSIIADLEDDLDAIRKNFNILTTVGSESTDGLACLRLTLERLDDLNDLMSDMLEQQQGVEIEYEAHLSSLQSHLTSLEHLYLTYTSYQHSYNNLLVEMDRRRQYRNTTRDLLVGMLKELDMRRTDELRWREQFIEAHKSQLPDDLCPGINEIPPRYTMETVDGDAQEVIPDIDEDLLVAAKKRIDLAKAGSESL